MKLKYYNMLSEPPFPFYMAEQLTKTWPANPNLIQCLLMGQVAHTGCHITTPGNLAGSKFYNKRHQNYCWSKTYAENSTLSAKFRQVATVPLHVQLSHSTGTSQRIGSQNNRFAKVNIKCKSPQDICQKT